MTPARTDTTVGIVGGGPAGLMLSHLLARAGVDSVVVDHRTREEIEGTVRAGILEADSVRLLVDTGVSDRVHRDGHAHAGIDLRFGGASHRVDFQDLVGESVWLYPQTDVFLDLADALRDKVRAAGFSAFVEQVRTEKGTLHRVRVGPVANRADAEQLKAQVAAKVGVAGMVRPHP